MSKKIVLATLSLLSLTTMNVQAEQVGMVTASTLNVRSGIGQQNKILFTLSKNEKVTIKSSSDGWYKIVSSKNKEGWASSQYIKTIEESVKNIKLVDVDRLNMRSGPSTSYRVLKVLSKGSSVEVISTTNNWSKIKHSGITGYVLDEYLKSNTTTKYANTSSVNVRSGPSTSNSILGKLNKNDKVEVISESGSWSKINYKGSTAYVSSQYLSNRQIEEDKNEEVNISNKKVTASTLNVRSGPSTSHSIIGTLYKGNIVKPLSQDNGWVKIKFNDTIGYISDTYLTNTSESENINGSNNSSSAGTSYNTLSYTLDQHVEVQYNKALNGGNKIDALLSTGGSGNRGYINATREDLKKYLNPDTFTSSSSGKNQFLRLDSYKGGVTVSQLNSYLNSLAPDSNGNNVFYNKGEAFINAAKKSDIDLAYFVAHAMVETGYGRSTLAKGQYINTANGQVKVYNFFGIAAFDGTADSSGKNYAYKMGWTSVEKTLEGSAQWIADNYIKNLRYNQNTLYKMRWSYENSNHQYATDVNWAKLIGSVMTKITPIYSSSSMKYEIPKYK